MKIYYIFLMDKPLPIQLIQEFESERDEIIFQTRENFLYVNRNGGTQEYSIEKLALISKAIIPELKWGKTTFQHFLEGKVNFAQQNLPPLVRLLELSIKLRGEIEPHIQKAQQMIKTSKQSQDIPHLEWPKLNLD